MSHYPQLPSGAELSAIPDANAIHPFLFADSEIHEEELMTNGIRIVSELGLFQGEWNKLCRLPSAPFLSLGEQCWFAGTDSPLKFVWCYFPWKKTLVRIPEENAFVTLRTCRNFHKLSPDEVLLLSRKRVGIIGLSVGSSAAIPLAMGRICGELRIADFDRLELTNMNRISASITDLGNKKAVNTARHIAEMDPFLKVKTFDEGIHLDNIEAFLLDDGPLDLVIEECDSGDIKLLTRILCRKHRIPVLMETSDRGLLDVERFDLEPDRPLLHGMLDEGSYHPGLTPDEKRALLMQTLDLSRASSKGINSLKEIGSSISTWPQKATDVVAGGATVAMAAEMILLGEEIASGRRYVDIQSIIRRTPEAISASED